MTTPMIEIDSVTKYFGDKLVLDRVSLRIDPHEVVCLIGASGSGKSTLLRCVNRLVDYDYGTIRLDGVLVDDPAFGKTGLQKRAGIVFQSYNLFPHMNVLDNITLAPRRVQGQSRAEAEDRGRDVLARFGMAGFAASYPEQLSGGQQQRVAIARALAHAPALILADEPTGNLDEATGDAVLDLLLELVTETGAALMMVTHSSRLAARLDRRLHLSRGQLAPWDTA